VISAFEYQWVRSELSKFSEYIAAAVPIPSHRAALPKKLPGEDLYFYESYNVWQERYVTELAWAKEEEEYRFITNYKRIHSSYPRRVNIASYTWPAHSRPAGGPLKHPPSLRDQIVARLIHRYPV
jgi:hypothetical protein